jgi:hypothetical protein
LKTEYVSAVDHIIKQIHASNSNKYDSPWFGTQHSSGISYGGATGTSINTTHTP